VNFTGEQIEIDAVDRDDAGIDLANAAQFERGTGEI